MNTADLRAFFSTVLYEDMIKELTKLTSFELHEPEDQTTEIILLSCDLKTLKSANLSIKEMEDCIRDDKKGVTSLFIKEASANV